MSDAAAGYQLQVGGLARGLAYRLGSVNFDGFAGHLIEAKGLGYARLMNDPYIVQELAERIMQQARDQLRAAGKAAIKWFIAEPEFATGVRNLLSGPEFRGITIVDQAPRFPL